MGAACLAVLAAAPGGASRPSPASPPAADRPRPDQAERLVPTPVPSPPPPVVAAAPPRAWREDTQANRGFAISYPAQWARAAAEPDAAHVYYATRGAPAPLEMSAADVWLTVQVTPDAGGCPAPLEGTDAGSVPAVLSDRPVRLQLVDPAPHATEPTYKAYAVMAAGRRCYELWFVTLNPATRRRQLGTMLQILAAFRPLPGGPAPRPSASPSPSPAAPPSPAP